MYEQASSDLSNAAEQKIFSTNAVHQAIVVVLNAITGCMESELLKEEHPNLFTDCSIVLWPFVCTSLKLLEFLPDVEKVEIQDRNLPFLVLKALNTIQSEYPTENVHLGVEISTKLALVYEVLERYDDAVQVIASCINRICLIRQDVSEGEIGLFSVTCSLNMHPEMQKLRDRRAFKDFQSIPWKEVRALLKSSPSKSADEETIRTLLVKALPSIELDMRNNLLRCKMKQQFLRDYVKERFKADERFRLTQKRYEPQPVISVMHEQDVKDVCLENPLLRAMMNITYASSGRNIERERRNSMLLKAEKLLHQAQELEKNYIRDILVKKSDSANNDPLSVFRISFSSATIKVNLVDLRKLSPTGKYFQILAHESSDVKVTVKDIHIHGTGDYQSMYCEAKDSALVKLSHLKQNQTYRCGIAIYDDSFKQIGSVVDSSIIVLASLPYPLSVCWGYLANAAGAIKSNAIVHRAQKLLFKLYVPLIMEKDEVNKTDQHMDPSIKIQKQLFSLDHQSISSEPPSVIQNLVHSIFLQSEKHARITHTFIETKHIKELEEKRAV